MCDCLCTVGKSTTDLLFYKIEVRFELLVFILIFFYKYAGCYEQKIESYILRHFKQII